MSFYLARLEAARHQHRMMEAAAAAAAAARAQVMRDWPHYPYQHAGLLPLPRPQHHHHHPPAPPPPPPLHAVGAGSSTALVDTWRGAGVGGSATGAATATAREEEEAGDGAGGEEEVRSKRPLEPPTTPRPRSPPPTPLRAGASLRGGVAGSLATGATAREEAARGGEEEEVGNKRPLVATTTPRARSQSSEAVGWNWSAGAGGSRAVDTWRGAGGSVARRDDGAPSRAGASLGVGDGAARGGVAGSAATGVTAAREETGRGGEVVRNKRPLSPTTPRPRSPPPPPKRRAVAAAAARRLFPPGCGRDDAAPPLASAHDGDASRCLTPRGHGGGGGGGCSGAPHKMPLPPPPRRPALAGGKVDSVLFEAASSPSAVAAAAAGGSISAGVTTDSGHHCQGERLVKSSETVAAAAGALMDAADSQGVAGPMVAMRFLPKPTTVSATRSFPPGCRRLGASLLAGDGRTNQMVRLLSPEEEVVPPDRDDMEFVVRPGSHLSSSVTLPEDTACGHGASVPEISPVKVYASHSSREERIGNRWHCQHMSSSAAPASGANVTIKPGGSSCNVVAESSAQGLSSKEGHSVSECAALNTTSSDDFADAVSGERAVMTKKVMHTPRKSVRPPRLIQKTLHDMEFVVRPGSHLSSSVTLPEATACDHGASVPAISPVEVDASHSSSGERIGNKWHCEEMSSSAAPAIDANANVTNKPGESSCNVVAESLAQVGEGAVVRKKVMQTPRKSVIPPRLIQNSLLDTQCRPFSMEIERKTEFVGQSVSMNDVEDTRVFTKDRAIQDPMSANNSTWTNGKEADFFGPKKRVKKKKLNKRRFTVKCPAHPPINVASGSALGSIEKLEDDEVFKALAADETNFEYVPQNADARSKVKLICTRFESICRAIVQATGHRSVKVRRIDLAADKLMRKLPGFTKQGPFVGSVPGVEVGDEFLYRVQLALVGLHRPFQGGIDATWHETGVRVAISVVASGGYPDEVSSSSGELVYTGSGQKGNGDQKLEHGNLALKNCIETKTPVRVIHGFKDQNREEFGSHSRGREISTFTYDGLYHVVDCWREGSPGAKVFKYKLQRIPGQPKLSLHMAN